MAKKSIIDSDPDDSGPQNIPSAYSRQPTKEYTQEELHQMMKEARKDGKRDILMSQMLEQSAIVVSALENVTIRLAEGAKDINQLKEDQGKSERQHEAFEVESKARLALINKVANQAQQATTLIETHINQCNERKIHENSRNIEEDKRWATVQKSLNEQTKRHGRPGKETTWDKIGVNVISAFLVIAISGGLFAYFFLLKGESNGSNNTNAGNDNQNKPSSIKRNE